MKKLLDMMADAPLDQLFQSAYIPQANQQGQNAGPGILIPGMMAGYGATAEQASPDSTGLLSALSDGQADSGQSSGGGWASLLGNSGLSSELASAAGLVGGEPIGAGPGGGNAPDGPSAVGTGLISASTGYNIEAAVANMLGFVPDNKGGFIPSNTMLASILSTLSNPISAIFKGALHGAMNNDMMGIESQMSIPEAMSILQGEAAYGGYGLAPAGYGLGDVAGGGYDSPGMGAIGGDAGIGGIGGGVGSGFGTF